MSKPLKIFLKICLGIFCIFFIFALVVGIILIMAYDSSKPTFTPDESFVLEDHIGSQFESSLENVALNEYSDDENKIVLSFTEDDLNNTMIRQLRKIEGFENYLVKDDNGNYIRDYLFRAKESFYNVKVERPQFYINDNTLKFKLFGHEKLFNYKTVLSVKVTPIIEDDALYVYLSKVKLGSLDIKKSHIKKILRKTDLKNNEFLDIDRLALKFDIKELIKENLTDSSVVLDFINNLPTSIDFKDNKLLINIDTKPLFAKDDRYTKLENHDDYELAIIDIVSNLYASDDGVYDYEIDEETFNKIIYSNIHDKVEELTDEFDIGSSHFTLSLNDFRYSIKNKYLDLSVYLNEACIPSIMYLDIKDEEGVIIDENNNTRTDYIEKLNIICKGVTCNDIKIEDYEKILDNLEINVDDILTYYDICLSPYIGIKDIKIDTNDTEDISDDKIILKIKMKISKEEIEDIVNNHPEDLPFPDVVIPGIND